MDEWKNTGPERMGMDIGTKFRGNLLHVGGDDMKMVVDLKMEGIRETGIHTVRCPPPSALNTPASMVLFR